jgi:uncharacterized protein YqgC (DUF456 family)
MYIEIITLVFLLLGALLMCLPMMPGMPLMFIMTVVYGFVTDFSEMEPWHLAIFGGLTLLSVIIDWSAGLLGAKFGGASRKSLFYGLVGMVIGLVAFPPFGMLAGLFIGIFLGEIQRKRSGEQALKSATSSLVATAAGIVTNIVLAFVYVITFSIIVFF